MIYCGDFCNTETPQGIIISLYLFVEKNSAQHLKSEISYLEIKSCGIGALKQHNTSKLADIKEENG